MLVVLVQYNNNRQYLLHSDTHTHTRTHTRTHAKHTVCTNLEHNPTITAL